MGVLNEMSLFGHEHSKLNKQHLFVFLFVSASDVSCFKAESF